MGPLLPCAHALRATWCASVSALHWADLCDCDVHSHTRVPAAPPCMEYTAATCMKRLPPTYSTCTWQPATMYYYRDNLQPASLAPCDSWRGQEVQIGRAVCAAQAAAQLHAQQLQRRRAAQRRQRLRADAFAARRAAAASAEAQREAAAAAVARGKVRMRRARAFCCGLAARHEAGAVACWGVAGAGRRKLACSRPACSVCVSLLCASVTECAAFACNTLRFRQGQLPHRVCPFATLQRMALPACHMPVTRRP